MPPSPDRFNGERCRVMIDADTHPSGVLRQVINAVRRGTSKFRNHEIMHTHAFRLSSRPPVLAAVFEISYQFLLLGVDRNHRLASADILLNLGVDVLKLRIAVRMAIHLPRFAV